MSVRWIAEEISEAIFPSNIYCISCGSLIDRSRPYGLCDSCMRKIHWIRGRLGADGLPQRICTKCGKALSGTYHGELCYDCMETEHYFIRGFSCMTYGLYEREIMMDIKYREKAYMASKMGDILFDRMESLLSEAARQELKLFDCVIPVPLSEGRLRKRGYNQAQLMARQMLNRWKAWADEYVENMPHECGPASISKPLLPRLEDRVLIRIQETEMLRGLQAIERIIALDGVFALKRGSEERIRDKSVLLIDDVYTTGATADSCSKVLLEGGASGVYLLTLASGGNRRKEELEKMRGDM